MKIPQSLVDSLRAARHVTILTGAGISAESGLATFRTPQTGLWERFRPEELATPAAFRRAPALVWGWYEWRRMSVLRASPNPGHRSLVTLESTVPRLTLVTQNVDDLHERAGSRSVLHLHGSLMHPFCESCLFPCFLPSEPSEEPAEGRSIEPPACVQCRGRVRPGVVWFGESLPQMEWEAAARAAGECDVFMCIGTSSVVQPAASLVQYAIRAGAMTVQINPNETGLESQVSHELRGPAGVVLPLLVERLRGRG